MLELLKNFLFRDEEMRFERHGEDNGVTDIAAADKHCCVSSYDDARRWLDKRSCLYFWLLVKFLCMICLHSVAMAFIKCCSFPLFCFVELCADLSDGLLLYVHIVCIKHSTRNNTACVLYTTQLT